MLDYDLDAYLGNTEATDDQRDAIKRAADAIDARWPRPDDADTREDALSAAVQVILGDATLEDLGAAYLSARRLERRQHALLTGALIASEGSDVSLSDRSGVTRMTVRKALGKR